MFDLQPPRHISTLRISPTKERPGKRRLIEPTAAAQPRQVLLSAVEAPQRTLSKLRRIE
jgi:hypothetical protein